MLSVICPRMYSMLMEHDYNTGLWATNFIFFPLDDCFILFSQWLCTYPFCVLYTAEQVADFILK